MIPRNPAKGGPESAEAIAQRVARGMIVNEYKERIGVIWEFLPKPTKSAIIRASDFTGTAEQLSRIVSLKWAQLSEYQKDLIGQSVLRAGQIQREMREFLLSGSGEGFAIPRLKDVAG